jgi:hypothetical protein
MDGSIPFSLPQETVETIRGALSAGSRSDKKFINQLLDGYKWQVYVSNCIQGQGFATAVHPLSVRPEVSKRHEHRDAFDVLVGPRVHGGGADDVRRCADCWTEVEVKARTRTFEDPESFPFDTIIIEPDSRYSSRPGGERPGFWCMVSQYTGAMIFVDGQCELSDEWKNGIKYKTAPRSDFLSLGQFVERLD